MLPFCIWNIVTMASHDQHRRKFNYDILRNNFKDFFPFSNVTDENIRFLSPQQAIADTAHFINHIQATVPGASNSQFILVGGHYSASLAVWFRMSFPHLALGMLTTN